MIIYTSTQHSIRSFRMDFLLSLFLLLMFSSSPIPIARANERAQTRKRRHQKPQATCISNGGICDDDGTNNNIMCCSGLKCFKQKRAEKSKKSKRASSSHQTLHKRCLPCKDEGDKCKIDHQCCSNKCRDNACGTGNFY